MPFFYASLHSTLLCLPIYCVTVMKKLLTLTVILYSLIFSSVSFGEWSEFGELAEGHTVYLDVEGMKVLLRKLNCIKGAVSGKKVDEEG